MLKNIFQQMPFFVFVLQNGLSQLCTIKRNNGLQTAAMSIMKIARFLFQLRFSIAFCVLAGAIAATAQPNSGWQKTFGVINGLDEGYSILAVSDGGFIASGITDGSRTYVLRMDADGTKRWSKSYSLQDRSQGNKIIAATNGDFFVAGRSTLNDVNDIQFLRINSDGNTIWSKKFGSTTADDEANAAVATADGGFVATGFTTNPQGNKDLFFLKVNANGDSLWQKNFGSPSKDDVGFDIIQTSDGGFVAVGYTNAIAGRDLFAVKLDNAGNFLWERKTAFGTWAANSVVETPDGGLIIAGKNTGKLLLYKIKSDGSAVEWQNTYTDIAFEENAHLIFAADGNLVVSGTTAANSQTDIGFFKININTRDLIWQQKNDLTPYDAMYGITRAKDGGFVAVGSSRDPFLVQNLDLYALKVDENGKSFSNYFQGKIFLDANVNCIFSANEKPLAGWVVEAKKAGQRSYAITDSLGNYEIATDTGNFKLKSYPPSSNWRVCQNEYDVSFANPNDTLNLDFAAYKYLDCPVLDVDISTTVLSRCQPSTYFVRYVNNGTKTARNVSLKVTVDARLQNITTSIAPTAQNGNVFTFSVDTLLVGAKGGFSLTGILDCSANTLEGQAHRTEVRIFPDSICTPPTGVWDGSNLTVGIECGTDSLLFRIKNTGAGGMSTSKEYIVIEDEIWLVPQSQPLQLGAGVEKDFKLPITGKTYRLNIPQTDNHPGKSRPTIALEGCKTTTTPAVSTGFVTMLEEDDADTFVAIDVQENETDYGGNVTRGYPKGYGAEHFITQQTELEYIIRFQNNGADSAKNLTLTDTLSAFLDPTTIKPGASSHPYRVELLGNGIAKFIFDSINLTDSSANRAASTGFVKFRINQKPYNPIGAVVLNRAAVQFDYQTPVATERIRHVVNEKFIQLLSSNTEQSNLSSLTVYPNPTAQTATFEWRDAQHRRGTFLLFDAAGKAVAEQRFSDSSFEWQRGNLPSGIYWFQIRSDEKDGAKMLHSGKLMLH